MASGISGEARRGARDARQREENAKYGAPVNVACSWSREEEEQLRREYGEGMAMDQMAAKHERGEMEILGRLVGLGLVNTEMLSLEGRGAVHGADGDAGKPEPEPERVADARTSEVPFGRASRGTEQGSLFEVGPVARYQ